MSESENGFVPHVEIPNGARSVSFLRERRHDDDNRRGSWDLRQLGSMRLIAPEGFEDVSQIEVTPIDEGKTIKVRVHAIADTVGIALVPVEDIPIQPYRVRVSERLKGPRVASGEDSFIKI